MACASGTAWEGPCMPSMPRAYMIDWTSCDLPAQFSARMMFSPSAKFCFVPNTPLSVLMWISRWRMRSISDRLDVNHFHRKRLSHLLADALSEFTFLVHYGLILSDLR